MAGPTIRSDILDVYVFRLTDDGAAHFLQLRRRNRPMAGTWQPVMGHVEEDETAARAALRELAEETAIAPGRGLLRFWQLELVNTYFLASIDSIIHGPCFAVEVSCDVDIKIDDAHDAHRWVAYEDIHEYFMWPGQHQMIEHITRDLLAPDSPMEPQLRIDPENI